VVSSTDGILTPLIKPLTEAALTAELEQHLASDDQPNRKNGKASKKIKTMAGSFELDTPRDRAGSFQPQLVKKNQTRLTDDLERKILSMFALGMSYRDMQAHVQEMYDMDISEATISSVTDQLLPKLKEWRQRQLDAIYPIVWLDTIHYKVKDEGRYAHKAIYNVTGR
jgi:putative transposase